ncbi:hypothetical protein Tco_0104391 [Tanacetum coccineum]
MKKKCNGLQGSKERSPPPQLKAMKTVSKHSAVRITSLIADIEKHIIGPSDAMHNPSQPFGFLSTSHSGFSQQKLVSFVTEIHTLSIDISLRDWREPSCGHPYGERAKFPSEMARLDDDDDDDWVFLIALAWTQGLEVGLTRRIHELDTAYWGFLRVGTKLDIFQNIIFVPYTEYGEYGFLYGKAYG